MSKSFNTVAVIATFLLCYTCANPVTDILKGTPPKAENATTLNAEINGTTPGIINVTIVTTTIAPNKTNESLVDVPPENHTSPTPPPKPTTLKPETTTANLTTTVSPPTTQNPNITTTSTLKPTPTNATTVSPPITIPSTSIKPATSTEPSKSTVAPTSAPHGGSDRKFDGPSFFGGIILACGLTAIGFIAFKFYKARTEHNYHTL